MMSEEEITTLQTDYADLNDRYTRLRTLYIESHLIWQTTTQQNIELRAAIHNLGG